jgi:hypothetical protein
LLAGAAQQHASVQQTASSSSSSSSSRKGMFGSKQDPESLAHSLAVASSVDQGISHSQMLLWHLNDEAASTCGGLRQATAAAAAAEDAYSTSSGSSSSSSSSSRVEPAAGPSSSSSHMAAASAADVPPGISLASGCISGFLTATVTFPLDVVRRRMQVRARAQQADLLC